MAPAFTFDGQEVPCRPGDTLGSALHRAGVKVLSRSLKYHRPRGLYCCTGSCASCFVDVDGVPNVPACMTGAHPGAAVRSQN
ncbi:MAG TPA: (2Fe-2S)-binding protein, partial [Candidatus Thermoplasmatota archaeon]|nr:(2Fe-2S)-binding protein [Candidatus Thermoplasmatota archaeon]